MSLWLVFIGVWMHVQTASKPNHDDINYETYFNILWFETTADNSADRTSTTPATLPFFEDTASFINITAQLGAAVVLHCRVNDLTERTTVSWLRRQEGKLHLLSVGMEVYSSDARYSATFRNPNDWQLHIQNTTDRDEGQYECQVSSYPPIVYTVFMHVVVPELVIADERGVEIKNKFYNSGSTIELMCLISKVPNPAHYIMWKHSHRVLNYDTLRGGISVKTDILPDGAKSRLFIANANAQDSGNYTCSLADVASTTVSIHVLNGETPAAMQHGGSSAMNVSFIVRILQYLFVLLTLIR